MTGHRKVVNVEWAKEHTQPSFIPRPRRLRGSPAKGISYERKFAREMSKRWPSGRPGQWYIFHADEALGYCQVDYLIPGQNMIVVFEVKLTNVEQATEQLLDLYFPVLRRAYSLPVRGIIVTKSVHRVPGLATITSSLKEAITLAETRVPVLHWLGSGPL